MDNSNPKELADAVKKLDDSALKAFFEEAMDPRFLAAIKSLEEGQNNGVENGPPELEEDEEDQAS